MNIKLFNGITITITDFGSSTRNARWHKPFSRYLCNQCYNTLMFAASSGKDLAPWALLLSVREAICHRVIPVNAIHFALATGTVAVAQRRLGTNEVTATAVTSGVVTVVEIT